ncbi:MAG: hypothetical protein H0U69_07480 [Trueperaceae bacterium]|nr:hypothetical protein [Trueperaceae bacterium]
MRGQLVQGRLDVDADQPQRHRRLLILGVHAQLADLPRQLFTFASTFARS